MRMGIRRVAVEIAATAVGVGLVVAGLSGSTSAAVSAQPAHHTLHLSSRLEAAPSKPNGGNGVGGKTSTTTTTTTTSAKGNGNKATAATTASAAKMRKVLVVLATWGQPDSVTTADAQSVFFSQGNTWLDQSTYGQLGLAGDAVGWVTIPGPDNGLCFANGSQVMDQAKAAAANLGYSWTLYDTTVVYFPKQSADCGAYNGWADVSGSNIWLNGAMTVETSMHELGHNLGLRHAHALSCQDTTGTYVTVATDGCTLEDYGDAADDMGSAMFGGGYSAPYLDSLGLLTGRVNTISTGQSATLVPLESATGVVGVKVTAATGRDYWLEWRTATGDDANLPSGLLGVEVRLVDANGPQLLDASPDGLMLNCALPFGGSLSTPEGLTISISQPSTTNTVAVTVN
jgi:hypothetical protein